MSEQLNLKDVIKHYHPGRNNEVRALRGVDLTVNRGEYLAIEGRSGSGKTSLLQVMGLLHEPNGGSYQFENSNTSELSERERNKVRAERIGMVFQKFSLLPSLSVLENVELGAQVANREQKIKDQRDRAAQLLGRLGLGGYLEHFPHELSGGEQQRVAIARATIKEPSILLADEPTGNLDSRTSEEVLDVLDQLHDRGTTVVIATHDPQVSERANRVVNLRDGRIDPWSYSHE